MKRIEGMWNTQYKDRLKLLGMYSTERRTQRYRIIYCWKIVQGLVPNCGLTVVGARPGRGRILKVPKIMTKGRKAREESFSVEGPLLFNCLPSKIRNFNGKKEEFKKLLDGFLVGIPDEPVLNTDGNNCTRANGCRSNSVRDWIKIVKTDNAEWWNMDAEFSGL